MKKYKGIIIVAAVIFLCVTAVFLKNNNQKKGILQTNSVQNEAEQEQQLLNDISEAPEQELEIVTQSTQLPELGISYYNIYNVADGIVYYEDDSNGFALDAYNIASGEKEVLFHKDTRPAYVSIRKYDDIIAMTVTDNGGTDLYFVMGTAEPVHFHHKDVAAMNDIYFSDDYILFENGLYEGEKITEILQKIERSSFAAEDIATAEYTYDSNTGKRYGSMVAYAGGDDRYIYYQIINMNGTSADFSNDYDYYRYDILNKSTEKLPKWEYKTSYLCGIGDYMLVSEFGDDYLDDSGKLLHLEKDGYSVITVPGICNGNDVKDAHTYDTYMLFNSNKDLYVFDEKTKEVRVLLTFTEKQHFLGYNESGVMILEESDEGIMLISMDVKRP
jgi:hypothetical protein